VTIEVLFIDGCPNYVHAIERMKEVLREMNLTCEVVEIRIADSATAKSLRLIGSPTVMVNGLDIEPSARASEEFGFGCRTYVSGDQRDGLPAKQLIREAILDEAQTTSHLDCPDHALPINQRDAGNPTVP
jgi:hypothetical protein